MECICLMKTNAFKALDISRRVGIQDNQVLDNPVCHCVLTSLFLTTSLNNFKRFLYNLTACFFFALQKAERNVCILIFKCCRLILSRFYNWFCCLIQCFSVLAMYENHMVVVLFCFFFLTENPQASPLIHGIRVSGWEEEINTGNFDEHLGARYVLNMF